MRFSLSQYRTWLRLPAALVQTCSRAALRGLCDLRSSECSTADLARSAIVFAPHPDDETLGCGGTIVRKKLMGAAVTVVFLTDGSRWHPPRLSAGRWKGTRMREALSACRTLGVREDDVIFLGFKDGELGACLSEASERVGEMLRERRPEQAFVPYYRDASPDHGATTQLVEVALKASSQQATVYEYPTWFWCYWPWIQLPRSVRAVGPALAKSIVAARYLLRDFNCSVTIADLLPIKRAALAQHRTQLCRFAENPQPFVLGDVSNGAFLACFFQDREVFYRHSLWSAAPRGSASTARGK
jgi:LmbE family N-acetylglucosaminyl deacetylase